MNYKIKDSSGEDIAKLQQELQERKALPMGLKDFMEWSDNIIHAAQVSATEDSQRWMIAAKILELGPTEAFKEDGFFVLALRKAAANEVAGEVMKALKEKRQKQAEETAPTKLRAVDGVLEDQTV